MKLNSTGIIKNIILCFIIPLICVGGMVIYDILKKDPDVFCFLGLLIIFTLLFSLINTIFVVILYVTGICKLFLRHYLYTITECVLYMGGQQFVDKTYKNVGVIIYTILPFIYILGIIFIIKIVVFLFHKFKRKM